MKTLIALTASEYSEYRGCKMRLDYARAILQAGAVPLILPLPDADCIATYTQQVLDTVQGVFLTGGGDILPQYFGQQPCAAPCSFEPQRDAFEIALIRAAWQRGLPILGICRGAQVLNIALGGDIHQDLAEAGFSSIEHMQQQDMARPTHKVKVSDNWLAALLGREFMVNSSHHQAVNRLAPGFAAAARGEDGVIEAVRATDPHRFALGLQWHPEMLDTASPVFRAFVENCRSSQQGGHHE